MNKPIFFRGRCSCGNEIRKPHPCTGFAEAGCPECLSTVKGYASPESDPPQYVIKPCRCGHRPGVISRNQAGQSSIHCTGCGRNGPECPSVQVAVAEWNEDQERLAKEEPLPIRPPAKAEDYL